MTLQRVNNSGGVPQNAVVGGYSPYGNPLYAILAEHYNDMYIAGNYEEGNDYAEYEVEDDTKHAHRWLYLVANGNELGWFTTVFSLKG